MEDKIFEIRCDSDLVSKIISYFPFSESEKQEICNVLNMDAFDDFHTILNTDRELAVGILWGVAKTLVHRLRDADNKVAATFAMAQFQ